MEEDTFILMVMLMFFNKSLFTKEVGIIEELIETIDIN